MNLVEQCWPRYSYIRVFEYSYDKARKHLARTFQFGTPICLFCLYLLIYLHLFTAALLCSLIWQFVCKMHTQQPRLLRLPLSLSLSLPLSGVIRSMLMNFIVDVFAFYITFLSLPLYSFLSCSDHFCFRCVYVKYIFINVH